jgi:hypothetical protein
MRCHFVGYGTASQDRARNRRWLPDGRMWIRRAGLDDFCTLYSARGSVIESLRALKLF